MTKKENKTKKKIKKKKEKQVKKKTRRSKKIKNALRKFTIVYQNIRGLKSKVDSVQELVDDCQPNLLPSRSPYPGGRRNHIYETIYRNDQTSNSGRILMTVKDTLKTITMQIKQETEVWQTLWILLNNQKKKIKIGAIYAPQEGVTPKKELKKLYTSITEEIIKAK